ncbi:MAG: carboxylesterase family protein [Pseudomonadales bacterium]
MKKLLILVALAIFGFIVVWNVDRSDEVMPVASPDTLRSLESGDVLGFVDRFNAHAWLGIPYALPPVGAQRWRAPGSPHKWRGRLAALEAGNVCPQVSTGERGRSGQLIGNEDCLYLNVWAPAFGVGQVPTGPERLPVMFWIHGGGNSIGHGASAMYNGALLASEQRLVVVSINYRLGPLGWFRHPSLRRTAESPETASGNFGTLDIIAALKWVRRNISQFGGDPGKVTIFGESAGGVDVLTMMASPLAAGLFHGAIVQSGGYDPDSVELAENFMDAGGHRLSSREVVSKLLLADASADSPGAAREIQQTMPDAGLADYLRSKSVSELFVIYSSGSFGMLQNPDVFADGFVLPNLPVESVFSDPANYNAVPLIIGTNRDEVKLFQFLDNSMVKKFFGLPYQIVDPVAYERSNRYGSDLWKARSVDRLASIITASEDSEPVFAYRFDVDDLRNLGIVDFKDVLGAAHALEIPFVFGNFDGLLGFIHPASLIEEREILSGQIMSYWAEFAYHQAPGAGRQRQQIEWKPWRSDPDAQRIIIFDYESDEGIHLSSLLMTVDSVKQRFIADTTFESDREFCAAYKRLFNEDASVARCL